MGAQGHWNPSQLLFGRGEVQHEQVASPLQHSHLDLRFTNKPMNHMSGLWEEAEENLHMHEDQRPLRCEARIPTTKTVLH